MVVPQAVEGESRGAVSLHDPGGDLEGMPSAPVNVRIALLIAQRVGEHKLAGSALNLSVAE